MKDRFLLYKNYVLSASASLTFVQFFQRKVYNSFIHIEAKRYKNSFKCIIKPNVGLKPNIETNTVKSISKLLHKLFNKKEYKYHVKEIKNYKNEFHISKVKDFIKIYNYVCGTEFEENNILPPSLFSTDYITDYRYEKNIFRELADTLHRYITNILVPNQDMVISIKMYKRPYNEYNMYVIAKTNNVKCIAKRIKNIINSCKYKSYKIADDANKLSVIQYKIPCSTMDNIKALIKITK